MGWFVSHNSRRRLKARVILYNNTIQYIYPKANYLMKRTKQMKFPFDVKFECARQTNSFFLFFRSFFHFLSFCVDCSESLSLFDLRRPLVVWSLSRFLIAVSRSFIDRLLLVIMTMYHNSRRKCGPNRNVKGDSRQKSHHFHLNKIRNSSFNFSPPLSSERIDQCTQNLPFIV